MNDPGRLTRTLEALRMRLHYANRSWTVDNYESLLRFFVRIAPALLDAERCGVFIVEPDTGRILSKAGTGLREREIEPPSEGSVVGRVISSGEPVVDNDLARSPGFHRQADALTGFETRSVLCAPIPSLAGGRIAGAIEVLNKRVPAGFDAADLERLREVAQYLAMTIENILVNREILGLSDRLDREVSQLRTEYLGEVPFVAESAAMRGVLELARMVSATPVSVLIQGENGTGKEVVARMIHETGARREKPFVAVNCAAVPETLVESEFFGYEKGAFTGAAGSRAGRLEEADGGTLFLDEVGEMAASMQPKLLRALQEGEGLRLGGSRPRRYDFRLVSASNRRLADLLSEGRFRQDLYYRLFAVEILVPPLRERREDIAPLAFAFLEDVCRRYQKSVLGLSNELLSLFESHPWPGNVRQLRREVERLVALTPEGRHLTPDRCSPDLLGGTARGAPAGPDGSLRLPERVSALERELIAAALERTGGRKARAAELLGITRQGLHKKLRRQGAQRPPVATASDPG